MKTLLRAILAAMALSALASPALAAPAKHKMDRFDFAKGDNIAGAVLRPTDGGWIGGTYNGGCESLIEYRLDFNPEMVKTTEAL